MLEPISKLADHAFNSWLACDELSRVEATLPHPIVNGGSGILPRYKAVLNPPVLMN